MDHISPREAAERLGVTIHTIYVWIKEGRIKATRYGHRVWHIDPAGLPAPADAAPTGTAVVLRWIAEQRSTFTAAEVQAAHPDLSQRLVYRALGTAVRTRLVSRELRRPEARQGFSTAYYTPIPR